MEVFVRFGVDGGVISVSATPTTSIGSLVKDSKSRLARLKDTPDDLIVAFKATPLDSECVRVAIGSKPEHPKRTLASLGTKAGDDFVFQLTDGAAASSGVGPVGSAGTGGAAVGGAGTGAVSSTGNSTEIAELTTEVRALKLQVASLAKPSSSTPVTLSAWAIEAEEVLAKVPGGSVKLVASSGEAVLTEHEQGVVSAKECESGIIDVMTPHLQLLCLPPEEVNQTHCPLVLVNSEHHEWLVQSRLAGKHRKLDLKPDLLGTWAPFVVYYDDGTGKLAGPKLQDLGCVWALVEGKKVKLGKNELGKQVVYHKCINKVACRGILFNATEFYLLHSVNGEAQQLIYGTWALAGSADAVRDFCAKAVVPALVVHLRALLVALDTATCHVADGAGRRCCYLGSGASGHVFTVNGVTDDAPKQALKVVLFNNGDDDGDEVVAQGMLEHEFETMRTAPAAAPIVPPVPGSLRIITLDGKTRASGGGYLLKHVGRTVKLTTKERCDDVFNVLAALHNSGMIHGDARLANIVDVDGSLKWIDFRTGSPNPAGLKSQARLDARELARSILDPARVLTCLETTVEAAVSAYNASDAAAVAALATAVWLAPRQLSALA